MKENNWAQLNKEMLEYVKELEDLKKRNPDHTKEIVQQNLIKNDIKDDKLKFPYNEEESRIFDFSIVPNDMNSETKEHVRKRKK